MTIEKATPQQLEYYQPRIEKLYKEILKTCIKVLEGTPDDDKNFGGTIIINSLMECVYSTLKVMRYGDKDHLTDSEKYEVIDNFLHSVHTGLLQYFFEHDIDKDKKCK